MAAVHSCIPCRNSNTHSSVFPFFHLFSSEESKSTSNTVASGSTVAVSELLSSSYGESSGIATASTPGSASVSTNFARSIVADVLVSGTSAVTNSAEGDSNDVVNAAGEADAFAAYIEDPENEGQFLNDINPVATTFSVPVDPVAGTADTSGEGDGEGDGEEEEEEEEEEENLLNAELLDGFFITISKEQFCFAVLRVFGRSVLGGPRDGKLDFCEKYLAREDIIDVLTSRGGNSGSM